MARLPPVIPYARPAPPELREVLGPIYVHRDLVRWLILAAAWSVALCGFLFASPPRTSIDMYLFWAGNTVTGGAIAPLPGLFFLASPFLLVTPKRARALAGILALPLLAAWLFVSDLRALPLAIGCTLAALSTWIPSRQTASDGAELAHWQIARKSWTHALWFVRVPAMLLLGPAVWLALAYLLIPQGPDFTGYMEALVALAVFPIFLSLGAVAAWWLTRRWMRVRTRTPVEWAYRVPEKT